MLAKIWKKVLMAICIVACVYNVMHKLVSRTSLELQLKSVEGQKSLVDSSYEEDVSEPVENKFEEVKQERIEQEEKEEEDTIVVIH